MSQTVGSIKTDAVKGLCAGAVGVWAMDVVTWWLYRREDPRALAQEHRTRPMGKDSAHAAARKLARLVGSDAARQEPNAGGLFIHYMLGIAPAQAYANQRSQRPWLRAGRGSLYGSMLYVGNDLVAGRLVGIVGPQRKYPVQAHLRGIVGHVVLGVVTELVLEALDEVEQQQLAGDGMPVNARQIPARNRDGSPRPEFAPA